MAERDDYYISFGSDASTFGDRLAKDLSGAREQIRGFGQELLNLDKNVAGRTGVANFTGLVEGLQKANTLTENLARTLGTLGSDFAQIATHVREIAQGLTRAGREAGDITPTTTTAAQTTRVPTQVVAQPRQPQIRRTAAQAGAAPRQVAQAAEQAAEEAVGQGVQAVQQGLVQGALEGRREGETSNQYRSRLFAAARERGIKTVIRMRNEDVEALLGGVQQQQTQAAQQVGQQIQQAGDRIVADAVQQIADTAAEATREAGRSIRGQVTPSVRGATADPRTGFAEGGMPPHLRPAPQVDPARLTPIFERFSATYQALGELSDVERSSRALIEASEGAGGQERVSNVRRAAETVGGRIAEPETVQPIADDLIDARSAIVKAVHGQLLQLTRELQEARGELERRAAASAEVEQALGPLPEEAAAGLRTARRTAGGHRLQVGRERGRIVELEQRLGTLGPDATDEQIRALIDASDKIGDRLANQLRKLDAAEDEVERRLREVAASQGKELLASPINEEAEARVQARAARAAAADVAEGEEATGELTQRIVALQRRLRGMVEELGNLQTAFPGQAVTPGATRLTDPQLMEQLARSRLAGGTLSGAAAADIRVPAGVRADRPQAGGVTAEQYGEIGFARDLVETAEQERRAARRQQARASAAELLEQDPMLRPEALAGELRRSGQYGKPQQRAYSELRQELNETNGFNLRTPESDGASGKLLTDADVGFQSHSPSR